MQESDERRKCLEQRLNYIGKKKENHFN